MTDSDRYCNGMRFVGKPGNMWTQCTKPGTKYRQRLWYCEDHFVPLLESLPTLDDLKAAMKRKATKKPRKRGPIVGHKPQTVIIDDPVPVLKAREPETDWEKWAESQNSKKPKRRKI